jgi:hypothetical protein
MIMGLSASLTRIPPDIYQAMRISGGFQPDEEILGKKYDWLGFTSVGLDKSWWFLNLAFNNSDDPIKYAIEGDYSPEGGLEAFNNGEGNDSYLAYVSPSVAKQISEVLKAFPIQKSLQALDDDDQYIDYCLLYYQDLVSFYKETAYHDDAVFISIF